MATIELEGLDNWMKLEPHPLCLAFPPASDEDYEALVRSMSDHGFLANHPITLIETGEEEYQILDGMHRWTAATDARTRDGEMVLPKFILYTGEDPVGYVVAANVARRQLTVGQKAAIAKNLASLAPGQHSEQGTTQKEAAEKVGVGVKRVEEMTTILKRDPELARAVADGEVPLNTALRQVRDTPPTSGECDESPAGSLDMGFETPEEQLKRDAERLRKKNAMERAEGEEPTRTSWKPQVGYNRGPYSGDEEKAKRITCYLIPNRLTQEECLALERALQAARMKWIDEEAKGSGDSPYIDC